MKRRPMFTYLEFNWTDCRYSVQVKFMAPRRDANLRFSGYTAK
jgi:hypothetical protein